MKYGAIFSVENIIELAHFEKRIIKRKHLQYIYKILESYISDSLEITSVSGSWDKWGLRICLGKCSDSIMNIWNSTTETAALAIYI